MASVSLQAYNKKKGGKGEADKPKPTSRAASPSGASAPENKVSSVRVIRAAKQGSGSKPTPKVEVRFSQENGPSFDYQVIPDTGATRTVIAKNVMDKFSVPVTRKKEVLRAANGQPMSCVGTVLLEAQVRGKTVFVDAIVSKDLQDKILLSWHDMANLGIISSNFPNEVK